MESSYRLTLDYSQVFELLKQMPLRSRLRLGKELSKTTTEEELKLFLDSFYTDEISEDDILSEVKTVRNSRYNHDNEKKDNN